MAQAISAESLQMPYFMPSHTSSEASFVPLLNSYLECEKGVRKTEATRLFRRIAATTSRPWGKLRAELIPDSSWKRAGKLLGPQASQTTARLAHILNLATSIWQREEDALAWLHRAHPELQGAAPWSLLRTESGGRAVEALLAALEYGFPV